LAGTLAACTGDTSKDDTDVSDTVDTTDTDDTVDTTDTDVSDTDAACWLADGDQTCWDCAPPRVPRDDSLRFYNRCDNATSSEAFDNAARIPASTWVPGTALPAIP